MPAVTDNEVHRLIEEHLPLVRHVVFQVAVHFPRHVDREELATAGALGLVEAARRYDESRGVPFDRFAAQRIRGAILDAVRAADWAPRSVCGPRLHPAWSSAAPVALFIPDPRRVAPPEDERGIGRMAHTLRHQSGTESNIK